MAAIGVLVPLLASVAEARPVNTEPAARGPSPAEAIELIEAERAQLKQKVDILQDVALRGEMSALDNARRRFSEGETQFLLENFEGCEALLRDVVEVPEFYDDPSYPLALYYLAESLMHTGGQAEARRHFLEAARRLPHGRRFQNVLLRLIELAELTGHGAGIDEHYRAAGIAGPVRPELVYRYAAWTSRRDDLSENARKLLALRELERLSDGPFSDRATYFRATLLLESGDLDQAVTLYDSLLSQLAEVADSPRGHERHLRDLARMAIARIFHAQGRFGEAREHYELIAPDSPEYPNALYEKADTLARLGNFRDALATAELLRRVVGAEGDSAEAGLLKARLLLQLGLHDEASAAFKEVSLVHQPDLEAIRELLDRPDSIAWFEELLAQSDGFDLNTLLPERARPYADTSRDIEAAKAQAEELRGAREDVEEARRLIAAMLERLEHGGVELFPDLQELDSQAVQLSNAGAQLERRLVRIQVGLLEGVLSDDEREELAAIERQSARLDEQFRLLPTSREEFDQRAQRFMQQVVVEERAAAAVRRQLAELAAEVEALERAWNTQLQVRQISKEQADEMRAMFAHYRQLVEQLGKRGARLDERIAKERAGVPTLASGGSPEEALRERFREQIFAMQRIIARASSRLPRSQRPVLARTQRERASLEAMQEDIALVRTRLAERAGVGADGYRRRVQDESAVLERDAARLAILEEGSRQLLGQEAWASFARVGLRFEQMVQQGEVGVIDVAWDSKELRSKRLRELTRERDQRLRELREQFREVLADAE